MVDKALDKAFDKTRDMIDRVEKGQSDDAPIDLPGTHKRRDTTGKEREPKSDGEQTPPTAGADQDDTAKRTR
jgi:hypothetical protein